MKTYIGIILQLILSFIFTAFSVWYIAIVSAFFTSYLMSSKNKINSLYISLSSLIGVFLFIFAYGFQARLSNSLLFSVISGLPAGPYLLFIILCIEVIATTLLASLIGSSISK